MDSPIYLLKWLRSLLVHSISLLVEIQLEEILKLYNKLSLKIQKKNITFISTSQKHYDHFTFYKAY